MSDDKLNINQVSSLTGLYLYCLLVGLQWSSLPQGHFLMTSAIGSLKLMVIAFLFCGLVTSRPVLNVVNIMAGAVFALSLIITKDWHLIFLLLFAFALKDIPFSKIGVTMAVGALTEILVLYFLCRLGIARDVIDVRWTGAVRHSYGFNNVNHFGIVFSVFIIGLLCFWFDRLSAIKLAILAWLALANYSITDSRASLLYVIVALLVTGGWKLFPNLTRKFINLFIWIFPVIVVIVCLSFYTYTGGPVESVFDKISSGRYRAISQVCRLIPIAAFQVPSVVKGLSIPFDCSYLYFFLVYGYVPAFVLLGLILIGLHVRNNTQKDACLVSVVVATLIYGFLESKLFDISISFPLAKVILDVPSNVPVIYRPNFSKLGGRFPVFLADLFRRCIGKK